MWNFFLFRTYADVAVALIESDLPGYLMLLCFCFTILAMLLIFKPRRPHR
jgi:hypothetical protein